MLKSLTHFLKLAQIQTFDCPTLWGYLGTGLEEVEGPFAIPQPEQELTEGIHDGGVFWRRGQGTFIEPVIMRGGRGEGVCVFVCVCECM